MPWQLSILVHSVLSASRTIQNKRIGRYKKDLSAYTLVASYFAVFLLGATVALSSYDQIDTVAAWDARYYLLLGGVLFTTANYLTLRLFRLIPASVAIVMGLMNSLAVVLVATLFAGESLTARQWVGASLLLGAVYLVQHFSKKKQSKKVRNRIMLGVAISIASALLIGFAVVNEKYLLDRLDLHTYLLYGWGTQFLSSWVVFFAMGRRLKVLRDVRIHVDVWLYSALLATAGFFFVLTLKNSDSSSLTAVSASAKVLFAMVLAYILLKERDHVVSKALGLIFGCSGLYLLFS